MARLVLCVLALCALGASAYKVEKLSQNVLNERQEELLVLFYHVNEPIAYDKWDKIRKSFSLEESVSKFSNVSAVHIYVDMLKNNWHLPRTVPFAVNDPDHIYEVSTLFNILYSAKDYVTFYETAVYLRNIVNEGLYVYVLSVAILYHPETQGVVLPPVYEIQPYYFNNAEIMNTAQRINTQGFRNIENYPSTYKWNNNVVIRWNETVWPYINKNSPLAYFTHDVGLNAFYYYLNLMYPYWLGSDVIPGIKQERRGELWLFIHRQIVARYYLDSLSSYHGEIEDFNPRLIEDGYTSGLLYQNGIPFPSRPNHFELEQPEFQYYLESALEYERRIWYAIDQGFILNNKRERIEIHSDEALDIVGNLIQSNADSPNAAVYRDFLRLWKAILGNSIVKGQRPHSNSWPPLVLPSVLENYQTALRDPAFYILWKRVLSLLAEWQTHLPQYEPKDLLVPSVVIEDVEVEKLVTYFEQSYLNLTSQLWLDESEIRDLDDHLSVVVQHPRITHKPFNIKIKVKSDVAKKVIVKIFLGPKYDSKGLRIPLHLNTENFVVLDEFIHDLSVGESVIVSDSNKNQWYGKDLPSALDLYLSSVEKKFVPDMSQGIHNFPARLMLPKGRVNGMEYVLMAYISEYKPPKVAFGTGFDPSVSLGLGSGARLRYDEPFGFPTNRPLYDYVVKQVKNLWLQDVLIYHKPTPEIQMPVSI